MGKGQLDQTEMCCSQGHSLHRRNQAAGIGELYVVGEGQLVVQPHRLRIAICMDSLSSVLFAAMRIGAKCVSDPNRVSGILSSRTYQILSMLHHKHLSLEGRRTQNML